MTVELTDRPRTPVAESVRRLTALVSPYTGVVRSVEEYMHAPDEPRLIKLGCEPTAGPRLLGADLAHLEGGGGGEATRREPALAGICAAPRGDQRRRGLRDGKHHWNQRSSGIHSRGLASRGGSARCRH